MSEPLEPIGELEDKCVYLEAVNALLSADNERLREEVDQLQTIIKLLWEDPGK